MARISIRRRPRAQRSLTAAAQRVVEPKSAFKSSTVSAGPGSWQDEAWAYLESVGELSYYVSWRSLSASRCRMVASEIGSNGRPTGSVSDDDPNAEAVRKIVADIGGGPAGQSHILRRGVYLLTIPGEFWAVMISRDPSREIVEGGAEPPTVVPGEPTVVEEWYVLNRQEIKVSGDDVILSLPDGAKYAFNSETDVMFRVWDPHPQDATKPVSAVWSNRITLNEIVRASATIDNAAKSRLVGNGLMFIPSEVSLPMQSAPTAAPIGGLPGIDPDPRIEPSTSQDLQDLLYEVASTAVKDPDSLAALLPIIASGPGEYIKNIQWIRPASDIPETALATRTEAIRRLAMGLDVAAERLLGMGENSNHWSAWLIDDNDVRIHIAPPVETICAAYTQELLRPKLIEEGIDPDRYVIWHDDTDLTQDPDKKDEALTAHGAGAIRSDALREYLGLSDSDGYDLTQREGWVLWATDRVSADPTLLPMLAPLLDAIGDVSFPDTAAISSGPAQDSVDAPAPDAEPQNEPQPSEPTPSDPAAPVVSSAAAMTIARLCVSRALELANKRRRTRSNSEAFRGIDIVDAHTRLDPVEYDDVDDLISGWSAGLSDHDLENAGVDPASFRSMVRGVAVVALVTSTRPVLTAGMLRSV